MAFIVLDLEWNQAISEKTRIREGLPFYLEGEVIQIGAVKLAEDFSMAGSMKLQVRPVYYTQIHQMIQKLTGITQEMMDKGEAFSLAMNELREWCGKNPVFLTWGDDDIRMLRQNMALHQLDVTWLDRWYNLQWFYSRQLGDGQPPLALAKAAAALELTAEAPAHDALNDAVSTALICTRLDMKKGFEDYNRARIAIHAKNAKKMGSIRHFHRGYLDHLDAFADKKLTRFSCPVCGEALQAEAPWASLRKNVYITLQNCPKHGPLYLRLSFSRDGDGRWAVTKSILPAAEDKAKLYHARCKADIEAAHVARYRGKKK